MKHVIWFTLSITLAFTSSSAQYSRRTVHLDNVDCHGHEGTLLACEHKSATSQEGRAAGVRCSLSMDTPGVPPCEAASSVLAGVYITLVILIISSLAIIILQAWVTWVHFLHWLHLMVKKVILLAVNIHVISREAKTIAIMFHCIMFRIGFAIHVGILYSKRERRIPQAISWS